MADISKCFGGECPLKDTCYRFLVPSNDWHQSYLAEPPYKDEKCEHYYETENNNIVGE